MAELPVNQSPAAFKFNHWIAFAITCALAFFNLGTYFSAKPPPPIIKQPLILGHDFYAFILEAPELALFFAAMVGVSIRITFTLLVR